ncbi:hypothetical protein BDA99DRAFT_525105, partial [Phascolomyces articulosus]
MSFHTFNAALPYFAALHDASLVEAEVAGLSEAVSLDNLKIASPSSTSDKDKDNKFMNALQRIGNIQKTANNANALKSTEDACLDLYYQAGVSNDTKHVHQLLEKSWAQDPEVTLHIIWHVRSLHRGKGENNKFYTVFGWLMLNHPQTAIRNLHLLTDSVIAVNEKKKNKKGGDQEEWDILSGDEEEKKNTTHMKSHGYWKDLVNICQIYVCNELEGPTNVGDLIGKFKALNIPHQEKRPWVGYEDHRHLSRKFYKELKTLPEEEQEKKRAERNAATEKKQKEQKEKQQAEKMQKRAERHARVTRLLNEDPCYRALHFTVARLFATQLKADLEQVEVNRKSRSKKKYSLAEGVSLAAKWAPTLGRSHDKHTLMATSVAELLYPPTTYQEKDESREHYLNKVREMYRKTYISPLRQVLDVTECKMSAREWKKIDFSHVPSKCMQANSARFYTHAKDEFVTYLKDVALGKKSVSGATLQPHELAIRARRATPGVFIGEQDKLAKKMSAEALQEIYAMDGELANAQWKTLIESIKNDAGPDNETLGSSIAVCDLSGSMFGNYGGSPVPVWPAVGLSLVLAELAAPPFNGSVITFTDNPTVVNVDVGGKLTDNVNKVFSAPVGYSTNFLSVFLDLLLPIAKENNLKQEEMVKRLFVFSDMEFNEGFGISKWETIYEQIKREYEEAGYKMPELVWWNLAQARPYYAHVDESGAPIPVEKDTEGCTMIGGFSAALMKSFFD